MVKKSDNMPTRSDELSLPRLLICEGPEDVVFFQRLIEARNLPRFHVRDTAGTRGGSGGNTKFGTTLEAISANRRFHIVRDIVLVTDNDEDQDKAFRLVRDQVIQAGIGLPPNGLTQPSDSRPRISIISLPLSGSSGSLESICLEAARRTDRVLSDHIDNLEKAVALDSWPMVRRNKFWLRCYLAGRASDPFIPLGRAFGDGTSPGLIPVNDPSFDTIAGILAKFQDPPTPGPSDGGSPPARSPRATGRARPRPRPISR